MRRMLSFIHSKINFEGLSYANHCSVIGIHKGTTAKIVVLKNFIIKVGGECRRQMVNNKQ